MKSIIFRGDMVRAILAGKKTETRKAAIEGIKCMALFAGGMGCKAISHELFGLIDARRVEAHLRRWL